MKTTQDTDLLIIGAGLAGMSAALFAANRNIRAVVTGGAGGFEYGSGLMDLWGARLTEPGGLTKKPWEMLERLAGQNPEHPLARIPKETIEAAFDELLLALKHQGLTYLGHEKKNKAIFTSLGTLKTSFRIPYGIFSGIEAIKLREPCLILGFKGLREFSPVFFTEMVEKSWKGLRPLTLEFPDTHLRQEVFTPFLARSLETGQTQEKFLTLLRTAVKDEAWLGLPAILGVQSSEEIHKTLEAESGLRIFEIPTSPISVPGIRLKEALIKTLDYTSITLLSNHRVTQVTALPDKSFDCLIRPGLENEPFSLRCRAILLATGRFLGQGLYADREKIHESLMDLPVHQPESRDHWHSKDYFDPAGHAINRAGIRVDKLFRPVDTHGRPVFDNLFACGTILSHHDWIRERCGSGLSIATAFQALASCLQVCHMNT